MKVLMLITLFLLVLLPTRTYAATRQSAVNLQVVQGGSQSQSSGTGPTDFAPIVVLATNPQTGKPVPNVDIRFTIATPSGMSCWIANSGDPTVPVTLRTASNGQAVLQDISTTVGAQCSGGFGNAFVVATAFGVQTTAFLTVTGSTGPYVITSTGNNQIFSGDLTGATFTITDLSGHPVSNVPVGLLFMATGPAECIFPPPSQQYLDAGEITSTDSNGVVQVIGGCNNLQKFSINTPVTVGLCVGSQWSFLSATFQAGPGAPRKVLWSPLHAPMPRYRTTSPGQAPICTQSSAAPMGKSTVLKQKASGDTLRIVATPSPAPVTSSPPEAHFGPVIVQAINTATTPPSPLPAVPLLFTVAAPSGTKCEISLDHKDFEPVSINSDSKGEASLKEALGGYAANCRGTSGGAVITASIDSSQVAIPLWINGNEVITSNDHQQVQMTSNDMWYFAPITVHVADAGGNPLAGKTLHINVLSPQDQSCNVGVPNTYLGTAVSDAQGDATFDKTIDLWNQGGDYSLFCYVWDAPSFQPQSLIVVVSEDSDPAVNLLLTETEMW